MAHQRNLPAPSLTSDSEHPSAPSDRVIIAGAGGAAVWVLTWLTVQLHGGFSWLPPLLTGLR